MNIKELIPKHGERTLIVGKTGSGKTALATTLLKWLDVPPIIYDTKIEPKFLALQKSIEVHSPEELLERYDNNVDINDASGAEESIADYFIVRPRPEELLDPLLMDQRWLFFHYNFLGGVPAYIDETAQWHHGTRAGLGLMSLLQRGRSRGIQTLMSTQRPRFISRSCFTEADNFFVLRLLDKDDRKRFVDLIPDMDPDLMTPDYHFRYFNHKMQNHLFFKPLPLDKSLDTGYTDQHANGVPDSDELYASGEMVINPL